jgi:hypothetical protein
MEMISHAIDTGQGVDVLDKLMGLQERWEANQARKAFDIAMSEAKSELGTIRKNREVDFTSSKGRTNYRHEDLAGIAKQVDPILSRHGLSYRYRTEQMDGGMVKVTCIVSHRDGFSEENSLSAGRDESGNKNNIQAVGSTVTYLQRYTLKAALGLAVSNDDDAQASVQSDPISEAQYEELRELIDETGANTRAFCEHLKVPALADLPAARFDAAKKALLAKKAKAAKDAEGGTE